MGANIEHIHRLQPFVRKIGARLPLGGEQERREQEKIDVALGEAMRTSALTHELNEVGQGDVLATSANTLEHLLGVTRGFWNSLSLINDIRGGTQTWDVVRRGEPYKPVVQVSTLNFDKGDAVSKATQQVFINAFSLLQGNRGTMQGLIDAQRATYRGDEPKGTEAVATLTLRRG